MTDSNHRPLVLSPKTLDSPFAEAYRGLRTNIGFRTMERPANTLAVMSASAGEGKTTTVVNLGIIIAQAGYAVVIVDADFRRSSLQDAITSIVAPGLPPSVGLSGAVLHAAEVQDVLRPTTFEHLSFLPAGPTPPNPGEVLASEGMESVITELAQRADFVIFDTPPCLLYADPFAIARLVDGIAYVVSAGAQNKEAQRRIQKQLQQAKVRVLGVVLNNVEEAEFAAGYGYHGARVGKFQR